MARLSFTHYFLLVLFVFSSVENMVPKADAGRCTAVLNPVSCDLNGCRKQCYQEYDGNGICIQKAGGGYFCQCVYNC
ncbi:putative defensin-like protein 157 [Magnolia sinica]|uniref:putative defensin-like protein 157 n=1 Tax=Magnolia sinica TaxID=86752 RepID=UPI00265982EE|nr:putative defensin-like protein 157 [Magnolia sinica]